MNTRARGHWPDGSPVVPAGGVSLFDRVLADLGVDEDDVPSIGFARLLDRHTEWLRWQDFLEGLRAVIGWPAVVEYSSDTYEVRVLVDGRVVGRMDDADRHGLRPELAGCALGMRVRRAWWGQEQP